MCHHSCLHFMLMTLKVNDFNITDFLDFGHDLINSYLKLVVLMYADDTIILCDSEGGMRQALIALNTFCNEWKAFFIIIIIIIIIAVFLLQSCAPYFDFEVRA